MKISKECSKILEDAEKKITILIQNSDEKIVEKIEACNLEIEEIKSISDDESYDTSAEMADRNIEIITKKQLQTLKATLKEKNKEIVILTSWFGGTQIPRLKRTGLYKYIDKIVAGEDSMKPDLESFELAIGNTPKEECLMVGDSIKSDKVGAENAGIDYYIIDKEHIVLYLFFSEIFIRTSV